MNNQSKKIEQTLKLYEYNLKGLPSSQKQEILLQISKDLEELAKNSQYKIREILLQNGGKLAYLNKFLVINNISVLPKLKRRFSLFKVFICFFLTGFLLIGLGSYFLVNKYLPLFEMNKMDNTISLLGGALVLESDSESHFANRAFAYSQLGMAFDSLSHEFSSAIASEEFSSIEIEAESLDLILSMGTENTIKMNCKTETENTTMLVDQIKNLKIQLSGMNQCEIWLPPQKWLTLKAEKAAVFVRQIDQSFIFNFKRGYVTMKKENLSFYRSLSANVIDGKASIVPRLSPSSKNTAEIIIEKGEFVLR